MNGEWIEDGGGDVNKWMGRGVNVGAEGKRRADGRDRHRFGGGGHRMRAKEGDGILLTFWVRQAGPHTVFGLRVIISLNK